MPLSIHGTNGITFNDGSTQNTRPAVGFRNRIINGDMRIDQRNAGAAVTTTGSYVVDRWFFNNVSDGTLSVQQSTDVPSGQGFSYSLRMTATVGDGTIGAAQYCNLQHRIEGFNFADFGFGAAGASSVVLSFWVKATVAGSYSVALYNFDENRINPQSFAVNAANTWERKTIIYTGSTTGTWLNTNGVGANVTFSPALGSNFLGASGWNSGGTFGVTGQANAISSNGNIFAITGVQLEAGSTATDFERRPYGTELALCQRYFYNGTPSGVGCVNFTNASYYDSIVTFHPVVMRAAPTITLTSNITDVVVSSANATINAITGVSSGTRSASLDGTFTAAQTSGRVVSIRGSSGGNVNVSAEL